MLAFRGGRRFGAAPARRPSPRCGSVFYPVSTQPRDRPRTLDATSPNCERTSRTWIVGARGFEPPTFRSRNGDDGIAASENGSQVGEKIGSREGEAVQPSQLSTGVSKNFTTRLLPKTGTAFAPGTAPRVATTPTISDLVALHGGRDRMLRVADVAEKLGVCAATVYRLCERGELAHVRIVNSIRIRPADLSEFLLQIWAPPTGLPAPRDRSSALQHRARGRFVQRFAAVSSA